jgi:DNA-binding PadR family transcriptional regulator
MERRGWLAAQWAISEKGRRAKYYRLTAKGKRARERTQKEWARYVAVVAKVTRS